MFTAQKIATMVIYSQGDHQEENTDVGSGQVAVELQAFESDVAPETDDNYTSEYAAIYEAREPQTMD